MKTKEELNALKAETEALSKKIVELNEEELNQVTGGTTPSSKTLAEPIPFELQPFDLEEPQRTNNGELTDLHQETDAEHGTLRFDSDLF